MEEQGQGLLRMERREILIHRLIENGNLIWEITNCLDLDRVTWFPF